MPSLRTLLLGLAVTLLAHIQLSVAAPLPEDAVEDCDDGPTGTSNYPNYGTTPTLPKSGDATELASPPAGQSLQYVAIGRGTQNYTCTAAGATPVAEGALATLYNFTDLAYYNENVLNDIPPRIVDVPRNSPIYSHLPVLGHHFFDSNGTPTFDLLPNEGKILYSQKIGDISAPASASAGPSGTGAVDWLELIAKTGSPTEISIGLQTVYRVVTAGGKAQSSCPSAGLITEEYAAEYWFFD